MLNSLRSSEKTDFLLEVLLLPVLQVRELISVHLEDLCEFRIGKVGLLLVALDPSRELAFQIFVGNLLN